MDKLNSAQQGFSTASSWCQIRAVKLPDAVFAASTREQARAAEEVPPPIPMTGLLIAVSQGATKFEPAPRRTKADEQNDMRYGSQRGLDG